LLEWLTELKEMLYCAYWFIIKDLTKDTGEQSDEEVDGQGMGEGCGTSTPLWVCHLPGTSAWCSCAHHVSLKLHPLPRVQLVGLNVPIL
jgi:hypothetical protein